MSSAPGRRTADLDILQVRTLNIRNPNNSAPGANIVLTSDGSGGTFFAIAKTDPTTLELINDISGLVYDLSNNVTDTQAVFQDLSGVVYGLGSAITENVMVASYQDGLYYTTSGKTWSPITLSFNISISCIAWNGAMWVAGGGQGATYVLAYSSDGIVWLPVENFDILTSVRSVAWNGSIWIAVGDNNSNPNVIAASKDGIIWYDPDATSGSPLKTLFQFCNNVAWSGVTWLVSGAGAIQNLLIGSSTDGVNWIGAYSAGGSINTLVNNGPYWLGGGSGPIVVSANEGNTWTSITPLIFVDVFITSIAWNGSMWVVTTGTGIIAYNFDSGAGINKTLPNYGWTVAYTFTQGQIYSVAWNGSSWYASGATQQGSQVLSSQDGITWTPITNNPSSTLSSITSRRPLPYVGAVPGRGRIGPISTINDITGLNQVYYNTATSEFYVYVP